MNNAYNNKKYDMVQSIYKIYKSELSNDYHNDEITLLYIKSINETDILFNFIDDALMKEHIYAIIEQVVRHSNMNMNIINRCINLILDRNMNSKQLLYNICKILIRYQLYDEVTNIYCKLNISDTNILNIILDSLIKQNEYSLCSK